MTRREATLSLSVVRSTWFRPSRFAVMGPWRRRVSMPNKSVRAADGNHLHNPRWTNHQHPLRYSLASRRPGTHHPNTAFTTTAARQIEISSTACT